MTTPSVARAMLPASIDEDLSDEDIAAIDLTKAVRCGVRLDRGHPLAFLRERQELTQVQVAKKAKITQSDVSRAEQRSDCLVSTLERYAKALGGQLRLVIQIGHHSYPIVLQDAKVRKLASVARKRPKRGKR